MSRAEPTDILKALKDTEEMVTTRLFTTSRQQCWTRMKPQRAGCFLHEQAHLHKVILQSNPAHHEAIMQSKAERFTSDRQLCSNYAMSRIDRLEHLRNWCLTYIHPVDSPPSSPYLPFCPPAKQTWQGRTVQHNAWACINDRSHHLVYLPSFIAELVACGRERALEEILVKLA